MERLKRNWKWLVGLGIFLLIYKTLIPYQYNYYLERDLIDFELTDTLIIIGIVFLISLFVFYRFLSIENDIALRIMKTFAFSVFMGIVYVIWIQSIIIASGLFLNRMTNTEKISERFEITYVMKNGEVGIRSLEDQYFERTENKFTESELNKIKEGDTIKIDFQTGFFGKKYLNSGKINIAE
ncbi:hypothetical protein [Winogradskyella wichelsiae]|uniref:hypothetical protein n=1 Tax=Winogradskyella wichelsiae TaxID=2697007 RepID=UPI003EF0D6D8